MVIEKCPINKELQYVTEILNPSSMLSSSALESLEFVESLGKSVPSSYAMGIGGTRFISFGTGFFINLPKTIVSLVRAVTTSEQAVRVQALWDSVSNAVSTFMDAVNIARAFEVVGKVSKEAIQWTSIAGKIFYPIFCIGVGFHIHDMKQFAAFYDKMKKSVLDKTRTEELSIENLTDICVFIEKKQDKIYKQLEFSEDMVLSKRFKAIRERIQSEGVDKQQSMDEAKKLLHMIKQRMHAKIGFNIASTAIKVSSVASMGVSVFGITAPLAVGVSLALSIVDLMLYTVQKAVLLENPLDENAWQYRAIRWVKGLPGIIQSSFQEIVSHFQRRTALV